MRAQTPLVNRVIRAFGAHGKLVVIHDETGEVFVQGRAWLEDPVWRACHDVVQALGGRYDAVRRGWVIPTPLDTDEPPTRTGLPGIDRKLNELDREQEEALRREARAAMGHSTPEDIEWAEGQLRDIDPATRRPVEVPLQTAEELLELGSAPVTAPPEAWEDPGEAELASSAGAWATVQASRATSATVPVGAEPAEGFHVIPIEQLVTAPVKLRQSIDDDYLKGLAATIQDKGVLQPILVRPFGDMLQVVAGEQRYRASQMAGLTAVPCMVKALSDREAFEAAVIENDQRKALTDYERAQAYRHLLETWPDEYPSQKVLAYKMGKSERFVSEHLAILEFKDRIPAPELQHVTHTQAAELRSASDERRDDVLKKIATTGEVPSSRAIAGAKEPPTPPPKAVSKAQPYWCSWCGVAKAPHQVQDSWDGKQTVCRSCLRPVERPALAGSPPAEETVSTDSGDWRSSGDGGPPVVGEGEVPCSTCADVECDRRRFYPVGENRYACDDYVAPELRKEAPLIRPPVDPFPHRLRVPVSQAERDVYADLLAAFGQGRLHTRPILNDDRVVWYVVRATYPDIVFAGVNVPVYLDNEAIHEGREAWDDAVTNALKRQGAEPQRFPYEGSLGVAERQRIVAQIIQTVNALIEGDA